MPRPKPRIEYFISKIINEYFTEINLNEILDNPIPTKYDMFINDTFHDDYHKDVYRFKLDNNNVYDVDFYKSPYDANILMKKNNETFYVNSIIIGFSSKENKETYSDNSIFGTEYDPYVNKTNRNEQYEVLGKVSYLIGEYMRNNPKINFYRIQKNTHSKNLSTYINMFKKQFEKDFLMYDTPKEFVFIRKEIH